MTPFIPLIAFLVGLTVAAVVAGCIYRQQERSFKICIASYATQIETLKSENEGLLDRLHATRNLPPQKVNMTAERQERRSKEAVREAAQGFEGGPRRVSSIGPVDEGQNAMIEAVRRRAGGE